MNSDSQSDDADQTAIVTIVTEDHLPLARSLLQTSADQGWQGRRFAVLVEDSIANARLPVGAECLSWIDLLPAADRKSLGQRYDISELCCALKPYAMNHLLSNGFDRVHYLDSDIAVFGSFQDLDRSLRECSIQLTPHYFDDPPEDGRTPDSLTLLRAGVFNAGYLGVRATDVGRQFLQWWMAKLRKFGFVDPFLGMHGDQRWLDLVPAKFPDVRILRDKSLNVGYWNLHERCLDDVDGEYLVDGEALVFFHFSGFDPGIPQVLSKHQNRHSLHNNAALSKIVDDYARLVVANGYETRSPGNVSSKASRGSRLLRLRNRLIDWSMPTD